MANLPKRLTHKKPPLRIQYKPLAFYYEDGLLGEKMILDSAHHRGDIFEQQQWVKIWIEKERKTKQ